LPLEKASPPDDDDDDIDDDYDDENDDDSNVKLKSQRKVSKNLWSEYINNADQPIWHKENKHTNNRSYRYNRTKR
jgi:hypothetical protein